MGHGRWGMEREGPLRGGGIDGIVARLAPRNLAIRKADRPVTWPKD